jgi:hypothetical protein
VSNNTIHASRKVFLSIWHPVAQERWWLVEAKVSRNETGELRLAPDWSSVPEDALGHWMSYEYAKIFETRWHNEGNKVQIQLSTQVGNAATFIDEGEGQ